MKIFSKLNYFSKTEKFLWFISVFFITTSFLIFDRVNYMTLAASLIGVTALIFCAKGNPFGQVLMIIFSAFYGYISYGFHYYGEMMTYVGMSGPMALVSLITWLKNPYEKNKAEVKVNALKFKDIIYMLLFTTIVTIVFYHILKFFNTANLKISTFSITTSFSAVYLTAKRSEYFALAYAINDIVLIGMWIMATLVNISYLSVIICFIVFLVNDIYSFFNWKKMRKRQQMASDF